MPTDNTTKPPYNADESSMLISYFELRTAIGIIGIALPFVLMLGVTVIRLALPNALGAQHSMSEYYYTGMGNVFVGSLCAIGVFLGAYRGYDRDYIAGRIACACSIGVALFPVSPDPNYLDLRRFVGLFHYAFAATLFLTLAYFCLKLFIKTHPKDSDKPQKQEEMTPRKLTRNKIYWVCGRVILVCIAVIGVSEGLFLNHWSPFESDFVKGLSLVYWFESLAVIAFGFSWLVKGEFILGDVKKS